jgi:hypothetical protein
MRIRMASSGRTGNAGLAIQSGGDWLVFAGQLDDCSPEGRSQEGLICGRGNQMLVFLFPPSCNGSFAARLSLS